MNAWKRILCIATLAISCFPVLSFAYCKSMQHDYKNDVEIAQPAPFYWVASLSGGLAYSRNTGKSTSFLVSDGGLYLTQYAYSANNSWQSRMAFGGFVGGEWRFSPDWLLQTGLGYYETNLSQRGTLVQGLDVQSQDTYNYHNDILARQFLLETKLLASYDCYHPYVLVGLGAAFNRSKAYEVDFPPFITFSPIYPDYNQRSFTYSLGLGVDMDVPMNWRVGVGYRFSDLGKSVLRPGIIDTTPIYQKIKGQSHLYANEIMGQLTYLFQ